MKVLHLLPNGGSGIESLVHTLAPLLQAHGVKSHLAYLSNENIVPAKLPGSFASINVFHLDSKPIRSVLCFRKLVKEIAPDAIHAHSFLPTLIGATCGRSIRTHIRTVHAPYPYFSELSVRSLLKRRLEGWALRQTQSHIVGVSNFVTQSLPWSNDIDSSTIYNGITAAPGRLAFDSSSLSRATTTVLAVGRLEKQKAYPRLIAAFSILQRTLPNAHLLIAGEGSERGTLERMISSANLRNAVTLLGRVEDVSTLYRSADLFVCSSDYEGMVLSAMESLCSGCRVASTPIPPAFEVNDLLGDGIAFAADFTSHALAHAMQSALHTPFDSNARRNLSERATRALSAQRCADRYYSLYQLLTDEHATSE